MSSRIVENKDYFIDVAVLTAATLAASHFGKLAMKSLVRKYKSLQEQPEIFHSF